MLLLCATPELSSHERQLREWYTNLLGQTDADELVRFIWERTGTGPDFLEALATLARAEHARPGSLRNLLAHSRKSPERRDAEEQIRAFVMPLIAQSSRVIQLHNGADDVIAKEEQELTARIKDGLERMFPGKHPAAMNGALLTAITREGRELVFNVASVIEALFMPDPWAKG